MRVLRGYSDLPCCSSHSLLCKNLHQPDTCSPSLTQQLSAEDEQHAPNSVMCSQVSKCTPATLVGQVPSHCTGLPEVSIKTCTATRLDCPDVITSHPIEATAGNEASEKPFQVCTLVPMCISAATGSCCASVLQQAVAVYQKALQHTNKHVYHLQREMSEIKCVGRESVAGEGLCLSKLVRFGCSLAMLCMVSLVLGQRKGFLHVTPSAVG